MPIWRVPRSAAVLSTVHLYISLVLLSLELPLLRERERVLSRFRVALSQYPLTAAAAAAALIISAY